MSSIAASPSVCKVCGAPLAPGTDRCTRCGAFAGEHRRCYGCGALAQVVHGEGDVYTCAACGRPRVPIEKPGLMPSGREREPLGRVAQARRSAILSRAGGLTAFIVASGIFMMALIAGLAGFAVLATAFIVLGVLVVIGGVVTISGVKRAKARANEAMREAFASVAIDWMRSMRSRGPVTAGALAEQLGIPLQLAEATLDRLPARDDVRVETVLDERATDGMVRYRIADASELDARDALDTPGAAEALDVDDAEQQAFDARLAASIRAKGPR